MTLTNSTVDEKSNQWLANDSKSLQQGVIPHDGHKPEHGRPQLFHGPFSHCCCKGCLEDAKREAEKRLSDESLAFGYIKKLEGMVSSLQLQVGDGESTFEFGGPVEPYSPFRGDTEGSKDENGPRARIMRMKKIWDPYGGEPKVERDRTQTTPGSVSANLKNESVLSVFREFDKRKNYWRRFLEIRSPPFIELLRGMVHSNIDIPNPDEVLGLKEPWMLLFHNRTNLLKYLQEDAAGESSPQTKTIKEHTKLILDFMQNECPEVSNKLDDLQSKKYSGLITYDLLWLLYPPGSVVFSKDTGEYEAFMIESIRGCQKHQPSYNSRHGYSSIELTCWSINYDGEIFGRVWSTHYLSPFEGTKDITSLPLVPEAFLPDIDSVKESLVDRGEKFWSLQGQCFREYIGEVWSSHMNEDPIRVMVDHLTYQRRQNWPIEIDRKRGPAGAQSKNWRENKFTRRDRHRDPVYISHAPPPPPPRPMRARPTHLIYAHGDDRDYSPDRYVENDRFEEPYERHECDRPPQAENAFFKKYDSLRPDSKPDIVTTLLCPQAVHGYCLRDKVWKKLNVSQLRPVNFRKNAWERLVLDEEYKDIVQAMVSSYVEKTANIDDLIAGKGAGLVTLLHGPPGTGKTLTAECVAESFEKPLYQVTCGEIGTHPGALEDRLEEIFDDAVTWGAILVLDEADVFLQERDYENLARNALVSIFLRTLEYFNGILFLTTNRVGTFDQAFQSRIHVTLGLPTLDQPRRTEVWLIFLRELAKAHQLTPDQLSELQTQVFQTWSGQTLNGRQIRNSVRTALLVAEKKKETVGKKHFDTVLRIGKEFENYMNVLRKGEVDVVAEAKGDRLADLGGFQEVNNP